MKPAEFLFKSLAVAALVACTASIGCSNNKSDNVAGPPRDARSAGKSGGNVHAGSGARASTYEGNPAPVDQKNTWAVDDSKLLPPSPLRTGTVTPKGDCIPAGMNTATTAFPTGSAATFAGELILDEAGASKADLEKQGGRYAYIPIPDTIAGFADGSVSVTPQMITVGHPMITEISETNDATLLQPGDDTLAAMTDKYGFSQADLPANSFKGQTEDLTLPSTTTTLIVRDDMSDDVAYAITKAIYGHLKEFGEENANAKQIKASDSLELAVPLHPGAQRYFDESK